MSDHKAELVLVENGKNVPGEIATLNRTIQGMLVDHGVAMDRKKLALEHALQRRESLMDLAINRLEAANEAFQQDLAEQFSTE